MHIYSIFIDLWGLKSDTFAMFSKKPENTVSMSTTPCAPIQRLYRNKMMMCTKVAKMDMAAEKPKTAEKSQVMEKGSMEGEGEVDDAALVAASE